MVKNKNRTPLLSASVLALMVLGGCTTRNCEDLGEVLGEGVKGQSLSAVYGLYQEGRLNGGVSKAQEYGDSQASWKGFKRSREEHITLLMAPLASGATVLGEETVDVVIKPSQWSPQ